MLSPFKRCTCKSGDGSHYLSCDLVYTHGVSYPPKRKRFFLFYPLKEKK